MIYSSKIEKKLWTQERAKTGMKVIIVYIVANVKAFALSDYNTRCSNHQCAQLSDEFECDKDLSTK